MKAISFSNPIFSGCRRHHHRCSRATVFRHGTESFIVNARRRNNDKKNVVDENMIVLRMRIKEVEIEEMGGLPLAAPENWMKWEKQYERYNEDVCEAIGKLQTWLMNTRPSLVLGVLILLMMSVFLSTGVVVYHFISSDIDTFDADLMMPLSNGGVNYLPFYKVELYVLMAVTKVL
ncbi:hypothetical protein Ccrd_005589 [Cynara cardunculus var. scolymus]|uniref:Uncharacterized protein n=1 Tax=Cynara cardunculus var. scolymus TaxID=59895 RepID=A0A118JV01_CYNCS|nr:hypothetical protein Ccrd_005589 [Cynara cardunculus var. scolymus]